FTSRRRHTRSKRDWSSDVCSSDLPDVEQKEAIIQNSLDVMKAIGYDKPKFAVLSAAEVVQPKLPASVDADELTKRFENNEDCIVEGPISLDLSINPSIAAEKGYKGKIQGDA